MNIGEAARDSGSRAGRNRFFVLLSGLPQMHVDVDQPRRDDPAGLHLEHVGAVERQRLPNLRDTAILDEDVERAVAAARGVYDASALQ